MTETEIELPWGEQDFEIGDRLMLRNGEGGKEHVVTRVDSFLRRGSMITRVNLVPHDEYSEDCAYGYGTGVEDE